MKTHKIEIGSGDTVIIDKLFGPTIAADLRIKADIETCCWIVERQWIDDGQWMEWCRIPFQLKQEFPKDEE